MKQTTALCVVVVFVLTITTTRTEVTRNDAQASKVTGWIDDIIKGIIEQVRKKIPDPLNADKLNLTLPPGIINGTYNASNIKLSGLSHFNVYMLHTAVWTGQLDFGVLFDNINVTYNYKSDLELKNVIPLYGDGYIDVHLKNVNITGRGKVSISHFTSISIKNLQVELDLDESSFDMQGLINNKNFSALSTNVLNDIVTSFVREHKALITKYASPIAEVLVNKILSKGK